MIGYLENRRVSLKRIPLGSRNISSWKESTLIIDFSYLQLGFYITKLIVYDDMNCMECLGGLHYVFKLQNMKVLTSEGIIGCSDSVYKKDNTLIMKMIDNCEDHYYEGDSKIIIEKVLFSW